MEQTKKDQQGNDIFWYVLGPNIDDWAPILRDVTQPVPRDGFALNVKMSLMAEYDFSESEVTFLEEQLADSAVVAELIAHYEQRLPKFSGRYVAVSPELIWGVGHTKEECWADAKYWWQGNGGLAEDFSTSGIELFEATDRAYGDVQANGADARHIVDLYDGSGKIRYYHRDEVSKMAHAIASPVTQRMK